MGWRYLRDGARRRLMCAAAWPAVAVFSICLLNSPASFAQLNHLSIDEENEVQQRLARFYELPMNAAAMNSYVPKYDLNEKKWDLSHSSDFTFTKSPLIRFAGPKAGPSFTLEVCRKELKRHFPNLNCRSLGTGGWAAVEASDKVEDLASGWIAPNEMAYTLDGLPGRGASATTPWSDDYWRMRWGGISFRYAEHADGEGYATWREAVNAYAQPQAWLTAVTRGLAESIDDWSPAEKYDLSVGDETFSLTLHQKYLGQSYLGPDGNVEKWFGLCHGWAPASIMVSRPARAITVTGARGVPVTWYPSDVKAIATLAWADAGPSINAIGGICRAKEPHLYPNGRLAEQDCFDSNPATFHLALGNIIGRLHGAFIMDKSFDYQIWNQPVIAYETTYFNPLNFHQTSQRWTDVAVPYDEEFKQRDRFQNPRTRGVRRDIREGHADGGIEKMVGAVTTVTYVAELHPPLKISTVQPDKLRRVTYTYDLELYRWRGQLYPLGGEWHENAHPDYLWMPRREARAASPYDNSPFIYRGDRVPSGSLSAYARGASQQGFPLCHVVKQLVKNSSGVDSYHCPGD